MKPTKIFPAEHSVVTYAHFPEIGTTFKDVLDPTYWTHVAKSLRVGHEIKIMSADGGWWALLLVRAVGKHDVVVQELLHVTLGAAPDASVEDTAYEVKWRGPSAKFGVLRKEDSVVIRDGFQVREEAEKWLKNHLMSLAA